MRRDQFDHLIRAAGGLLGLREIIVIGSQSILGALPTLDRFPEPLLRSIEVDILPSLEPDEESIDRIDAFLGELSQFHENYGVYADGVDASTARLPAGWEDRLIAYTSDATGGITAMCLEPHDVGVAKLIAGRDHDYEFCGALVSSGIVDPNLLRGRLAAVPDIGHDVARRVAAWIDGQAGTPGTASEP